MSAQLAKRIEPGDTQQLHIEHGVCRLAAAFILLAHGDLKRATEEIDAARRLVNGSAPAWYTYLHAAAQARIAVGQGQLAIARRWLTQASNCAPSGAPHSLIARLIETAAADIGCIPSAEPAPMVRITTLGRFELRVDDAPLYFSGKVPKKPLELLKALVAFSGRDVREDKLCEALWPDADGDAATQALATTLHRLRQLIGHRSVVRRDGRISLDRQHCWVDVWAFERHLLELDCRRGQHVTLSEGVQRLLELYHGAFLEGDDDWPWVLTARERLRAMFLRRLEAAAHRFTAVNRHDDAIVCYAKALEIDPLSEAPYRGLMRAHLALGHKTEAAAVYERCTKLLASQLGISPSPDTEMLARQVHAA